MMMNLFSIFDPSTSMNFSMNWISSIYIIMFYPNLFWLIPSRWNYMYMNLLKYLINEFYMLLNKKINVINMILFIGLFMSIMLNNFMGLFPYIYTSTSQMTFSMTLSMSLWIMMMLFGWMINTNFMFTHLVPQGTPNLLMPFMVLIESISNVIRPITLAVRLSANMIAGHLLMTLISSTGSKLNMLMLFIMLMTQSMLIILELSVSVIQAYVFSVLSLLYSTETN
uniref:ATP synthase subunit a n=1 Tax=Nasonia vitripennis TaxID=7425 RepID=B5T2P2_NASVI|nr:ATP synthase F0 subunit 6 [Nasonia vitripennis]ACH81744.1 ATP synthase subunit 6 [Nasonia vitripennis]ACH85748.1 ATP synthase subunit 6 [Nasonia vitripennis]ACH85752.1 ATP synthase subunit 6 [Nasonia vitripennis]ACH85756.1 ATP synthase subunit 6 [Nasonia vitripennis]ACH85764.1 ATP synthase subunit 6 [Nasonia vitripennis]